ncbi:hypothetical protein THAOC_34066 [Thalassiosira oceanica]|uniref:Uncharacterized protein n=1 Tax=Thalassiosira oceanica TaxID=159749 RepID=K0RKQ8_THAOC|nr:hypothetical protein THAOC_34066 [Thalassiosira oceanica]|eukprot:EJK47232.1 hypothetical protein THAOC_34066 [Thalassiosira oceanica]
MPPSTSTPPDEPTNLRTVAAFQVGTGDQAGDDHRGANRKLLRISRSRRPFFFPFDSLKKIASDRTKSDQPKRAAAGRGGGAGLGSGQSCRTAAGYQTDPMGDQLHQAASKPEVFLLYEGGEVAEELIRSLTHVRVAPHVTKIPNGAFRGCDKLVEIQFNGGLRSIGSEVFAGCKSLLSVTIPSTVTELGQFAFYGCSNLVELQLKEGLQVIGARAFDGCKSLRGVTLPSTVTELGVWAFINCCSLIELQLNEGLQIIGGNAFQGCKLLRSVSVPSTVTKLGAAVFHYCSSLNELHLNEGLQNIGAGAFEYCSALRSVTIPSTVTKLGDMAFCDCGNLFEAIFLNGKKLLNQEFFTCGFRLEEQGLLNQEALNEMFFDEDGNFAFDGCAELRTIKISISWAVSERMAQLPHECMLSVEERIHYMSRFELLQDGTVLACFPVAVSRAPGDNTDGDSDDETEGETYEVLDTNLETARSLYQVLQLIAFHELKESSILIELALWKSTIEEGGDRACRIAIPGPAKILLMEYCGFAGVLRPAF